jgi:DNA replication protein DnaC
MPADSVAWYRDQRKLGAIELSQIARAEQKSAARNRIDALLMSAGLPAPLRAVKFADIKIDHPQQRDVVLAARQYTKRIIDKESAGANFLLVGGPGVGKSTIAAAIANTVAEHGLVVLWVNMPDLIRQVRDAVNGRADQSDAEVLNTLAIPDLLIIDEFGRHQVSDFNRQFVWNLVFKRHEAGLPMVCTTNSTEVELARLLDPAALSRLSDNGSVLLRCDWPTYRGQR